MERWKRNAVLAFGKLDTAQKLVMPAWQAVREQVNQAQLGRDFWPDESDLVAWKKAVIVRDAAYAELQIALSEQTFSQSDFLC